MQHPWWRPTWSRCRYLESLTTKKHDQDTLSETNPSVRIQPTVAPPAAAPTPNGCMAAPRSPSGLRQGRVKATFTRKTSLDPEKPFDATYSFFFFRIVSHFYVGSLCLMRRLHFARCNIQLVFMTRELWKEKSSPNNNLHLFSHRGGKCWIDYGLKLPQR